MRSTKVYVHKKLAGYLVSVGNRYLFCYLPDYSGPPVSLTMPVEQKQFQSEDFPAFFDGLLPEGPRLEGLLRLLKIDRKDYFSQLMAVGSDLVGAVTVEEACDDKVPDFIQICR